MPVLAIVVRLFFAAGISLYGRTVAQNEGKNDQEILQLIEKKRF